MTGELESTPTFSSQVVNLKVGESCAVVRRLAFDKTSMADVQTMLGRLSTLSAVARARRETDRTFTIEVGDYRTRGGFIVFVACVTRTA